MRIKNLKEIGLKSKMTSENKFKYSNILLKELLLEKPRNGLYKSIEYQGKGNRLIKMKTIFENDIISNQKMELIQVTKEEEEKFSCKTNDLVFSRTSIVFEGVGKCCIVDNISDKPIFESNTFMIRLDPSKSVPKFYFYYFNSPQGRNNIYGIIRQTAASQITSSDLMELSIPYPLFSIQQNVSSFLFSIDQRIINLKQQNFILEMIIQSIFKSWFIDFDGITEFEDSELGKIPKGWKITTLEEFVHYLVGFPFKSKEFYEGDDGIKLVRGDNVKEQKLVWGDKTRLWREVTTNLEKFLIKQNDVLIGMDGSKVGKNFAVVYDYDLPLLLVQRVARLRSKNEFCNEFIWQLIKNGSFTNYVEIVQTGSAIPHISKEQILDFPVLSPSENLIKKFHIITNPMRKVISENNHQIIKLEKITDSLLPKLMSGEIQV